ncbi:hypothetical protein LRA02_14930 [Lentilactobacillus rapi]|uniref:Uncharacterized protein n=1 Tax=Lentilactobacillus rapi TaxID=481723 RepID=A0A512PN49_9LACO|nr:hypothetical protein LRA02_14930 [Lentilactobacillus rapi]
MDQRYHDFFIYFLKTVNFLDVTNSKLATFTSTLSLEIGLEVFRMKIVSEIGTFIYISKPFYECY